MAARRRVRTSRAGPRDAASGGAAWPGAEQLAPLTGIAPVMFGLAGLVVWEGRPIAPSGTRLAAHPLLLRWPRHGHPRKLPVCSPRLFFLCFGAGWLRGPAAHGEGHRGWRTPLTAAAWWPRRSCWRCGVEHLRRLVRRGAGPQGAQTFYFFGTNSLSGCDGRLPCSSQRRSSRRAPTGALPRWLAWASLVLTLWLLIPPSQSAAGTLENPAAWTGLAALPLVLLWAAAVSMVLRIFPPSWRGEP